MLTHLQDFILNSLLTEIEHTEGDIEEHHFFFFFFHLMLAKKGDTHILYLVQ